MPSYGKRPRAGDTPITKLPHLQFIVCVEDIRNNTKFWLRNLNDDCMRIIKRDCDCDWVKGIHSLTGVKYYFSHRVLTGCGAHPDPFTGVTAGSFPLEDEDNRFLRHIGA